MVVSDGKTTFNLKTYLARQQTLVETALDQCLRVAYPETVYESMRYSLQGLSLLPLFYGAVRYPRWLIFRPLNGKIPRFLGTLSYSLYLVHFMVLVLVSRYLGNTRPLLLVVGFVASLTLAYLIHLGVEKPAARLKARLSAPST